MRAALRILLVVEATSGGTGRHVADLTEGLCERGHDVSILFSPDRADMNLVARLKRLQRCTLTPLAMQRSVGIQDVLPVWMIRAFLRDSGPFDVVHAHSSKAGALLRLALIGDRSTPCVYTPHALVTMDSGMNPFKRLAFAAAEVLLSARTQSIICVSDHEMEHARELGIRETRLIMVPNGIDATPCDSRYRLREQLGFSESTVCVGTVGRLTYQKALHRLVSAFSMIHVDGVDTRLVIVGDGPLRSVLTQQAERLGIRDRVTFTGADEGMTWMNAFDIFAMTSLYEAFPYVLLEAAATGLPVVMTHTGGAGMIVRDGENGVITPQDDLEPLASGLARLMRDKALRCSMGECSRQMAKRYGRSRMVEGVLSVYGKAAYGDALPQ